MTGKFAVSKAGHDKGQLYVIIKEEGDFVYLSDGRLKPIDNPKKKRLKHIQHINCIKPEGYNSNEEIKRAIKLYKDRLKPDLI